MASRLKGSSGQAAGRDCGLIRRLMEDDACPSSLLGSLALSLHSGRKVRRIATVALGREPFCDDVIAYACKVAD